MHTSVESYDVHTEVVCDPRDWNAFCNDAIWNLDLKILQGN